MGCNSTTLTSSPRAPTRIGILDGEPLQPLFGFWSNPVVPDVDTNEVPNHVQVGRVQFKCFAKLLFGLFSLAGYRKQQPQIRTRLTSSRHEPGGVAQVPRCFVKFASLQEQCAEIGVCQAVKRIRLDRGAQGLFSGLRFARLELIKTAVVQPLGSHALSMWIDGLHVATRAADEKQAQEYADNAHSNSDARSEQLHRHVVQQSCTTMQNCRAKGSPIRADFTC